MSAASKVPLVLGRPPDGHVMIAALSISAACLAQPVGGSPHAVSHLGRGPCRVSIADAPGPSLGASAWVRDLDRDGNFVTFIGQSAVSILGERVFALGRAAAVSKLFALDRSTGSIVWESPVPAPAFNSWTGPVLDLGNGTVIVASGSFVACYDQRTGSELWKTATLRPIVNSSPLVTTDRLRRDRLFVTDFSSSSPQGRIYCINIDPYDAAENPYKPGDLLWSLVIGQTSGNSPAYHDGIVYVATIGNDPGFEPGTILAFDADAEKAPLPLWIFQNVKPEGFFGGVCVAEYSCLDGPALDYVYAASYAFYGGQDSANLVKVDAQTGALVWSVDSNRTSSIPIPLSDGRIVLSTGVAGYGSLPSIQLFRDGCSHADLEWDSAVDTWVDSDGDTLVDVGEFLLVGGWSTQPVVDPISSRLYVGAIRTNPGVDACTDFYALDLDFAPSDPAFVADHFAGCGSSPALCESDAFTIGGVGLFAFSSRPRYDVNTDGHVDEEDVRAWQQGQGPRDVNMDGSINADDLTLLLGAIAPPEPAIEGGRAR